MNAKVCVWFVLCEGREWLVLVVDMLCMYVCFKDGGFQV